MELLRYESADYDQRFQYQPLAKSGFSIRLVEVDPELSSDGKPQIAIWTNAWMKRLVLIRENSNVQWPALPLLIAQGHDWHLLIVSKTDQRMTIWEQVDIGSTRLCFDAMKVVTVLH